MIPVEPLPKTSGMKGAMRAIKGAGQLGQNHLLRASISEIRRNSRSEQNFRRHLAVIGLDDLHSGMHLHDLARAKLALLVFDQIAFVEDHEARARDLVVFGIMPDSRIRRSGP